METTPDTPRGRPGLNVVSSFRRW